MKKRIIVLLVTACLMGVQITAMAVDPEPPMFTVTLVPHEKDTNLLTDVTDAEAGEEVQMDVMLKNNRNKTVCINSFTLELDLPSTLTYVNYFENYTELEGSLSTAIKASTNNRVFDYYSGGDDGLVELDSGAEVKLLTLKLKVADNGITYGDILTASMIQGTEMIEGTNFHLSGTTASEYATIVPGQVEIVTTYNITWTGMVGNDETEPVGIGLTPVHDDPIKAGYTFTGWAPTLAAATTDATYTAQWSPTAYTVSFAEGTAFAEGVTPPTTYDIEHPITVIPTRTGNIFKGWTATPATEGDTDYNWPAGVITYADGFTDGYYGNVVLTPEWTVDAEMRFADYAYAAHVGSNFDKLLLIGVSEIADGDAVFYNGDAMFLTDDENYLALLNTAADQSYQKVYVTLVPFATSALDVLEALSIDVGTNQDIQRGGNVNGDSTIDSTDFGIVDDLLIDSNRVDASIQMRLEADVNTNDGEYKFGTIDDIVDIIRIKNNSQ